MHDGHNFHTYARHSLRYISSLILGTMWAKCPPLRTKWASGKGSVRIATLNLRIVLGAHLCPFLGMPLWNSASKTHQKHHILESCRIKYALLWLMDYQWCANHMSLLQMILRGRHISSHSMVWSKKFLPQNLSCFLRVNYRFSVNVSYGKGSIDSWRCVIWCK